MVLFHISVEALAVFFPVIVVVASEPVDVVVGFRVDGKLSSFVVAVVDGIVGDMVVAVSTVVTVDDFAVDVVTVEVVTVDVVAADVVAVDVVAVDVVSVDVVIGIVDPLDVVSGVMVDVVGV